MRVVEIPQEDIAALNNGEPLMIKKSAKKTAPKISKRNTAAAKSKKSSKRKTPKASKGKKKGAAKSRRKKGMAKTIFEVPVDVDVLIVPRVHLRVSMQVSEGEVVELQPVQSAPEQPKADNDNNPPSDGGSGDV